jgi:CRP/FNR family cyclic AMP-dependent transcriptional regulator
VSLLERFGRKVPADTVLFKEDESGREMYVIQSGKVRLTREVRGEEQVLVDLGAGEFFGEMSILNDKPRSATATVIEDAQLLVLDPKTFEAMIKANTEIAVRMIKRFAKRLEDANERIENLLLKDVNSRVVHHVIQMARQGGETVPEGIRVLVDVAEITMKTGIDPERIQSVISRMERSQLVIPDGEHLLVPDVTKLDEFLEFLEMREKFGEV